jgi:pectin methylesterase-like acyl-CoA thioesterase
MNNLIKIGFTRLKGLIILLLALLPAVSARAQALNGTYTIGGNAPDYATLTAAVSALTSKGISGPVIFDIRPGVYTEQIRIAQFYGASASSTVTFRSSTGNPADVLIKHSHLSWSTDFNYTLFIDGADYLTFKNLTLEATIPAGPTSSDYNRVMYVTNNSNNLVFENNVFRSWKTRSSSYFEYNNCIVVGTDYNTDTENDSITFRGNTIIGGSTGIYMQGDVSAMNFKTTGWVIDRNIFRDQTECGIAIWIARNTRITGNRLLSMVNGIEINQNRDSLLIDGNYITINGGHGISLSYVMAGSSSLRQISNNSITVETQIIGTPKGITALAGDTVLAAYNSIYMKPGKNTGHCISANNGTKLKLYNNQLVHAGGGLCYYDAGNSPRGIFPDYNNLFNNGNTIASINGSTYNTLADLQSNPGIDKNSVSVNPLFISDTTLIPGNPQVFEKGKPLSSVLEDFFGTLRSTSLTDIGIYEGAAPANDAGIANTSLLKGVPCPDETLPLYVTIKNFGTQPLTSVQLYYSLRDTLYGPLAWSGNLAQWQTDSVLIGNVRFYRISPLRLKAWTASPNGTADPVNVNDTIRISGYPALRGIYTLGSGANFPNLTEAVKNLVSYGVCAPVTFSILPGTYTERVVIPAITGCSPVNTVTIQSSALDSTSVVIQNNATDYTQNYIIKLDGAANIHIKSITFNTLNSSFGNAIHLTNGASGNTISGNVLTGVTNTISNTRSLIFMENGLIPVSNNTIRNNVFSNGGNHVNINGVSIRPGTGNVLVNNRFEGSCGLSIHAEWQNDLIISGNVISGTRNNYVGGINLSRISGQSLVEQNKLTLDGQFPTVIFVEYSNGSPSAPLMFRNNFVALKAFSNGANMNLSSCSYIKILNNSFNHNNKSSHVIFGSSSNIELYNNIYNCENGGVVYRFFSPPDTSLFHSNNNCIYTSLATPFEISLFSPVSIQDWKKQTGQDMNSIITSPMYMSSTDLHINNAGMLNGTGRKLADVTHDIDGQLRDSLIPDIGADEFDIDSTTYRDILITQVLYPDTLSCSLSDSLIIEVKNNSIFPVTSFTAEWFLFGRKLGTSQRNIMIPPKGTIRTNLGAISFVPNTLYQLDFEISNPNNLPDNFSPDNRRSVLYSHLKEAKIFSKGDKNCSNNTELYIKNFRRKSVLWSTGATASRITVTVPGTYSVQVTDTNGCTVSDSIIVK